MANLTKSDIINHIEREKGFIETNISDLILKDNFTKKKRLDLITKEFQKLVLLEASITTAKSYITENQTPTSNQAPVGNLQSGNSHVE